MMRKTAGISLMLIVTVFLAGCGYRFGRRFATTHVNDIQNGVQDKATILEWFGEPLNKAALPPNPKGCVEGWQYVYRHVVGYAVGTVYSSANITDSYSLVVDFDANGKVCDHVYVNLYGKSK